MNLLEVGYPDFRRGKKESKLVTQVDSSQDLLEVYNEARSRIVSHELDFLLEPFLGLDNADKTELVVKSFENYLLPKHWDLVSTLFSNSGFTHKRHIEHAIHLGLQLEYQHLLSQHNSAYSQGLQDFKHNIFRNNSNKRLRYENLFSLHQTLRNLDYLTISANSTVLDESYLRYPQR